MRYLRIELIEDGSSTHLGEYRIDKNLSEKLAFLESSDDKLLKKLFTQWVTVLKESNKRVERERKLS